MVGHSVDDSYRAALLPQLPRNKLIDFLFNGLMD